MATLSGKPSTHIELETLLESSPYSEHMREVICAQMSEHLAVLDVGCGPGLRDLRLLKELGVPHLVGIDLMSRVELQAGVDAIEYVCSDVDYYGLPLSDSSFDVVILDNVIEHLYDPRRVLLECNRVLRKNGSLIVLTPNQARLINRARMVIGRSVYYPLDHWLGQRREHIKRDGRMVFAGHIREYTLDELKRLVEVVGLKTVSVRLYTAARPSLRDKMSNSRLVLSLYNLVERMLPNSEYMMSLCARKP